MTSSEEPYFTDQNRGNPKLPPSPSSPDLKSIVPPNDQLGLPLQSLEAIQSDLQGDNIKPKRSVSAVRIVTALIVAIAVVAVAVAVRMWIGS